MVGMSGASGDRSAVENRQRPQLAGFRQRQQARGRTERHLDVAGDQVRNHRRRAAIRHRAGVEAGARTKIFHRQMR
jgi:hypothetical protein